MQSDRTLKIKIFRISKIREQRFPSFKNRIIWSKNEDRKLKELVEMLGEKNWTLVADSLNDDEEISSKTGKQCRERWHNHINPKLFINEWDEQSSFLLFQLHETLGNRWSEISKKFPGRSDNNVKNHYYSMLRKKIRRSVKELCKTKCIALESKSLAHVYIYEHLKTNQISYNNIRNDDIEHVLVRIGNKNINSNGEKVSNPLLNQTHPIQGQKDEQKLEDDKSHLKASANDLSSRNSDKKCLDTFPGKDNSIINQLLASGYAYQNAQIFSNFLSLQRPLTYPMFTQMPTAPMIGQVIPQFFQNQTQGLNYTFNNGNPNFYFQTPNLFNLPLFPQMASVNQNANQN